MLICFFTTSHHFLANVNYLLSPVRLSVICNVRAPYSGSSNFRQYFYNIRHPGHPLTSTENFTKNHPRGQGVIKPLFCVLEDELLSASDELLRETGQPYHVVRSHNELNVAKVASCVSKFFFSTFFKFFQN